MEYYNPNNTTVVSVVRPVSAVSTENSTQLYYSCMIKTKWWNFISFGVSVRVTRIRAVGIQTQYSKVFVSLELCLVKSLTNLQQCFVTAVVVINFPHRHGFAREKSGKHGHFLWRGLRPQHSLIRIRSCIFHSHHQKAHPPHVLGDCGAGNQNWAYGLIWVTDRSQLRKSRAKFCRRRRLQIS